MMFTPFWCKSYTILVLWVGDGLITGLFGSFFQGQVFILKSTYNTKILFGAGFSYSEK